MALLSSDPLRDLEHDHAELSALALAVRDLIQQIRRGSAPDRAYTDLRAKLDELREGLLLHFAREEEGLFPFVAAHVPDLGDAVARLRAAHDEICGAVLRASHAGRAVARAPAKHFADVSERFDRFEIVYAEHARIERDLLRVLAERLDEAQRKKLLALIDGL